MFTRSTRNVTQPSCWFVARRFVVADGIRGWSLKSDSARFISRCGALDAHCCSISPVAYLCCRRASTHRAPGRAQHTWATEHTWAVSRHFKGRRHCDRQPDASFIFCRDHHRRHATREVGYRLRHFQAAAQVIRLRLV